MDTANTLLSVGSQGSCWDIVQFPVLNASVLPTSAKPTARGPEARTALRLLGFPNKTPAGLAGGRSPSSRGPRIAILAKCRPIQPAANHTPGLIAPLLMRSLRLPSGLQQQQRWGELAAEMQLLQPTHTTCSVSWFR